MKLEPDRIPGRPIAWTIALTIAAILACALVIALVGAPGHGEQAPQPTALPPSAPFSRPTDVETTRAAQRQALDRWFDDAAGAYLRAKGAR
jgi:hypothetical protein